MRLFWCYLISWRTICNMYSRFSFSSVSQSCLIHCNPMDCSMPGFPVHHQYPERAQTHVHWVGDAIQPSHPLSFPSPPAFNLSQNQGLCQGVSSSHQVARVLEFLLQHPSFQYSGLVSFRIDWFDLLVVQGTLKSLLLHHNSKASILQCSEEPGGLQSMGLLRVGHDWSDCAAAMHIYGI